MSKIILTVCVILAVVVAEVIVDYVQGKFNVEY